MEKIIFLATTTARPEEGGGEAQPTEARYQVSIQYKNLHTCGGAIINREWILTSTRCVLK